MSFLFAHRRGYGVVPAAGAATLPPSADGESPAEVQRKTFRPERANTLTQFVHPAGSVQKRSRPERANPPAAVRAPRWVGAEKEPPRQDEHAYAVRMPRSPGAEKPCRRFVHRHIKAKPRFPSVFELSIKTISHKPRLPRGSAYAIQAAQQSDKNRGRVPRFLYFKKEKSFCIGTFLRPCSAKPEHNCRKKR